MTETAIEFNENPEEPWLTDEDAAAGLNWRWRSVIKSLMDGQYMGEAYAAAYEIDYSSEQGKRNAQSNGSRLMRNDRFRRLWRRVLVESGFSDAVVDTELYKLITDRNVEDSVRLKAIIAYNTLRGRITRNLRLEGEIRPNPYGQLSLEELRALAAATKPSGDDNG